MELSDFYDLVRPREFEDRLRGNLVDELNRILDKNGSWRGRKLHAFGSFMSGLYLPTGDMDLVLCSDAVLSGGSTLPVGLNQLKQFRNYLRSSRVAVHNNFEMISKARVPLVKYVDSTTGLKVDISFENPSGVIAIQTFKAWREQYPVMPVLVTIIKQFLLMRGLNEPVNGGIGGFSVICMVVSMLQMMPQIQSGDMMPERNLGSLLMHFFDLYGNRLNYKITALRLNPPGYVNKAGFAQSPFDSQTLTRCPCLRTKLLRLLTGTLTACPSSIPTIPQMTFQAVPRTTLRSRPASPRHTSFCKRGLSGSQEARNTTASLRSYSEATTPCFASSETTCAKCTARFSATATSEHVREQEQGMTPPADHPNYPR